MAGKFGVFVDEKHDKLPTLYWLHKFHKRPYKLCFIALMLVLVYVLLLSCLNYSPLAYLL